jgi:hypothetical protein
MIISLLALFAANVSATGVAANPVAVDAISNPGLDVSPDRPLRSTSTPANLITGKRIVPS